MEGQQGQRLSGEVVYVYAYDLAYDMKRAPMKRLLGQPVTIFATAAPTRHSPREMLFFRPQMVKLPPVEREGPEGPVSVERTLKLFPIGAVTATVRVPFEGLTLRELLRYQSLRFDGEKLEDWVRALAAEALDEVRPMCIEPVAELPDAEAYTVFCIHAESALGDATARQWLERNRRDVTALLNEEPRPERLSAQEIDESTALYLTYYDTDLIVVDWDAALIIERHENLDELLHVMELANVQLAELRAYDRILDRSLQRSYSDLAGRRRRGAGVLRAFRELRLDLARLGDELSNITKFFGDWHLARVYQHLSRRFHLSDWTRTLAQKLRTVDELYQLLKQDQMNRWMLFLEITIVVLFIIDVIIILVLGI